MAARSIFPRVALVVSGGHTHLFEVRRRLHVPAAGKNARRCSRRSLRQSGQAARLRLSGRTDHRSARSAWRSERGEIHAGAHEGQHARLQLQRIEDRRAALGGTARSRGRDRSPARVSRIRLWKIGCELTPQATLDLLASFQRTVIEELLRRAIASVEEIGARALIISGGVASNAGLRAAAQQREHSRARSFFQRRRSPPTMPP